MGFTGLVFVFLAVVWLVYLVPVFLQRKDNGLLDEAEPGEPFTPTVTIVRRGVPLDVAEEGTATVSTPLNRRAALAELDLADRRASTRRSAVLAVLLGVVGVVAGLTALQRLPWWSVLIPVALIVAFLSVARVTVVRMRADLEAQAERIKAAHDRNEQTVAIDVLPPQDHEHEQVVDLSAPIAVTGSLWEPVPITKPTYVSKPLGPRTVRTIDLSAPVAVPAGGIPVTADAPETHPWRGRTDRAVNE